jgi:hypothetical protein
MLVYISAQNGEPVGCMGGSVWVARVKWAFFLFSGHAFMKVVAYQYTGLHWFALVLAASVVDGHCQCNTGGGRRLRGTTGKVSRANQSLWQRDWPALRSLLLLLGKNHSFEINRTASFRATGQKRARAWV